MFMFSTLPRYFVVLVALLLASAVLGCTSKPSSPQAGRAAPAAASVSSKMQDPQDHARKPLTPEEERIIVHKGTERPFTGQYVHHKADGTYACRRCGHPLFPSSAKFDSGTGWPSFDEALPGAVRELSDADGMRTEIVCAQCGAHLGHVFRGEGFTKNDTRNCVNSASLAFEPLKESGASENADNAAAQAPVRQAYFAGGCFWGVEYHFEKLAGVLDASSGYMGGQRANPSYEEVSSKATGHAETVRVTYDSRKVDYETLAKLFFDIHDPTQVDRQGPDVGSQYRSAIFVSNDDERRTVRALIQQLESRGYDVATEVEPAERFWPAEGYHQDYYSKSGKHPYCHTRVDRFGDG